MGSYMLVDFWDRYDALFGKSPFSAGGKRIVNEWLNKNNIDMAVAALEHASSESKYAPKLAEIRRAYYMIARRRQSSLSAVVPPGDGEAIELCRGCLNSGWGYSPVRPVKDTEPADFMTLGGGRMEILRAPVHEYRDEVAYWTFPCVCAHGVAYNRSKHYPPALIEKSQQSFFPRQYAISVWLDTGVDTQYVKAMDLDFDAIEVAAKEIEPKQLVEF